MGAPALSERSESKGTMPRMGHVVLIADALPDSARAILAAEPGVEAVVRTGLPEAAVAAALHGVHGLIVRSATQVTARVLEGADALRVIGRAGTGVDNIDVEAATRRGVVVMNVPAENTISAAEHTWALLLALARRVPEADRDLKAGKWNRKLEGTELHGKTLGLLGCGRVGREVATRALAFGMTVVVHDPFLTAEAAARLGVTCADLETVCARADVLSLHVPLTDETRNLLSRDRLARVKPGVLIVNCARGGLVDEAALADALAGGRVGGAACDVFAQEPPGDHALLRAPRFVGTPHLGASTAEAQDRVGRRAAEQVLAFLRTGAAPNAVNAPSVPPELLPRLAPFLDLAGRLGPLLAQVAEGAPRALAVECRGAAADLPAAPITLAAAGAYLGAILGRPVPPVAVPLVARERGCALRETRAVADEDFASLVICRLETERETHEAAGTIFGRREPRLVRLDGYELDARPAGAMLLVTNDDRPGMIGHIGTVLGAAGCNIAECSVGRDRSGGHALAVLTLDAPVPPEVCARIAAGPGILSVRRAQC